MTFHPDADHIDRYLAGQLPPELHVRVEEWIAERPEHAAAIALLRAKAHGAALERAPATERWLARLQADIVTAAEHTRPVHVVMPESRVVVLQETSRRLLTVQRSMRLGKRALPQGQRWISWSVATMIAVIGVIVGTRMLLASHDNPAIRHSTYVTGYGQLAHLSLRDGTRVTLAPNSTLRVSRAFGRQRDVALTGEAYFDVVSVPHAPFLVHTGTVTTRVLGTMFDVRHYAADTATRVVVVSGKVAIGGRRSAAMVIANTMGYATDTTATTTTVGDVESYADWTSGRLTFKDVPASVMLATVGRWYGYDFRLADSALAAQHIRAVFDAASREKTLTAIKILLDVTMTFDDTTVTLHPLKESRRTAPSNRRWDGITSQASEVGK